MKEEMKMTEGRLVWKSPNKKWEIRIEKPRLKTDWNDGYSGVVQVSASDGWNIAYASINVDGKIHTGDYMTKWEYFVPKFVEQKAFSILRAEYKKKKLKTVGRSNLTIQY